MLSIPVYLALASLLVVAASRAVLPVPRRSAAVLVLLPLLFTGGAMLRDTAYAPADIGWNVEPLAGAREEYGVERTAPGIFTDITSQIAPWRHAVHRAWRAGEWPLVNPGLLCGDLLAGTAQAAPFYPLVLLTVWLPFPVFLTLQTAFAFLVAALGAWLFFADHELGELPSLLGAAGWAFSSFVAFWIHWPMGVAVGWLPLVLLGGRRVVRAPGTLSALLLAVALACPLLAGHPETGVHLVLFGALWAAIEWLVARPAKPGATVAAGLAGGTLALALSAVALLPILEALPQTFEHAWRQSAAAWARRSVPWPDALHHLAASAVPFAFGVPGEVEPPVPGPWRMPGTSYVGSVLLPLALLGLSRRGEPRRWALPPSPSPGSPPACRRRESPRRSPRCRSSTSRSTNGSSSSAASGWWRSPRSGWRSGSSGRARGWRRWRSPSRWRSASRWRWWGRRWSTPVSSARGAVARGAIVVLSPALLGAAALAARGGARATRVAGLALVLLLAQRRAEIGGLFPLHSAAAFYPRVAPLDRLGDEPSPYRVVGHGYALLPATASHYGLEDPRGYQALTLRRLLELHPQWSVPMPVWFNRVDDLEAPLLDLMNVRYALTGAGFAGAAGWELVAEGAGGAKLFRNREALERAFVPARVRFPLDGAVTVREMAGAREFATVAWIEDPRRTAGTEGAAGEVENGPGRVSIRADGAGYRLSAEMERPGWAVVTMAAWKGWRARAAGRELPLAFGDHAFLAVELPAGASEVELSYLPPGFVLGGAITAVTLVGLVGLGGLGLLGLARRRVRGAV